MMYQCAVYGTGASLHLYLGAYVTDLLVLYDLVE